MHTDEAARPGEGVQRVVAHGEEIEGLPHVLAGRHQLAADQVQVILDLGIIEIGRIAPAHFAHEGFADPPFGLRRDLGLCRLAEIRQPLRGDPRQQSNTNQQRNEAMFHNVMIGLDT